MEAGTATDARALHAPPGARAGAPAIAPIPAASGNGASPAREVDVAIIGAGFSGLAAAIRLQQEGRDDFLVLERGEDVGGTWRDNTYPGCRCDVPSHLYSLSFAPNPDWSESFSPQEEIWSYLRGLVDRFAIGGRIELGCEVGDARWDPEGLRWRLATSKGEVVARVLISAIGGLVEPRTPPIDGLESFPGKVMHSACWDHDHDLRGERVAVVGTGASAIQIVPAIEPEVASMHVFQRTPPWIAPRFNRPISGIERRLFRRLPSLQRLARGGLYWSREIVARGLLGDRRVLRFIAGVARRHLRRQVPDPELRRKLTPDYEIGCKRILISNDYYPALAADKVELVDSGMVEVRGSTLVAADGSEIEVDTIIFATGFHVADTPAAELIHDGTGRSLREAWGQSMFAHRGVAIPGFPNLFMVFGPHAGIGHTSATVMIEAEVGYVLAALRRMEEAGAAAVSVRPEALRSFLDGLDRRLEGTVWTSGGCASWYQDATGKVTTLWPDYTFRFQRLLADFDLGDYEVLEPARVPTPGREAEPLPAAAAGAVTESKSPAEW